MIISGREVTALDCPEVLQHLFHPRKDYAQVPPEGALDFSINVEEGVSLNLRCFLCEPAEPHILLFHGNGEIVRDYDSIAPDYNRHAMSLLVVDYRGYGLSGGEPTATTLLTDAPIIFTKVRSWLREQNRPGPLVVMGRSLGSAPALEVVSLFQPEVEGLILESAFARTIPLLRRLGVATDRLGLTEADGFANFGKIRVIGKPTLIIHGPHDDMNPLEDADILMANSGARNKQLMLAVGCGHDNIIERCNETYFETLSRFAFSLKRGGRGQRKRGALDRRYPRRR